MLILASSSPYRRALLDRLGMDYHCVSPEIDETPGEHESAEALVARLALEKAWKVAREHPQALVIGSDQVCAFNGLTLGKPGSEAAAREQLRGFSGQRVSFHTGLALVDGRSGTHQSAVERFDVVFRGLSADEIERYVARERPLDCAGAFRMEGLGIALFERFEGDDPNTLIGLPLIRLCAMLRRAGLDPLGAT